jgi:Fe-S-cluster containining protein
MTPTHFWHAGLHFGCRRCDYCCTFPGGVVVGAEIEFKNIADYLKISFFEFLQKYAEPVFGYVSLRSVKKGPCIFYQNGCSIYPVRPVQCQTYPFWEDPLQSPERWSEEAQTCPGIGQGQIHDRESIQKMLDARKQELCRWPAEVEFHA